MVEISRKPLPPTVPATWLNVATAEGELEAVKAALIVPVKVENKLNGILLLGHTGTGATGTQQFWAGTVYHYMTGICYGLIFAFLIHPLLPLRNTVVGNIGKALIWGGVLGIAYRADVREDAFSSAFRLRDELTAAHALPDGQGSQISER